MEQQVNQSLDPTLEPEELSEGFKQITRGIHSGMITDVSAQQDFVSKKGNAGWRWEFTIAFDEFDPSGATTCKFWIDNSSQFGATCLHNMFIAIGLPYTIPNKANLSKSTGLPLKSFLGSAVIRNLDNTFAVNKQEFIGRKALYKVRYKVQCPTCNWSHLEGSKITKNNCPNQLNAACDYNEGDVIEVDEVKKIFTDIDTTMIMQTPPSPQELAASGVPVTSDALANELITQQLPQQTEIPTPPPITNPNITEAQPQAAPIHGDTLSNVAASVQPPATATVQPVPIYDQTTNDLIISNIKTTAVVPDTGTIEVTYAGTKYTINNLIVTKAEPMQQQPVQQAPPTAQPQQTFTQPPAPEAPVTPPIEEDDLPF